MLLIPNGCVPTPFEARRLYTYAGYGWDVLWPPVAPAHVDT